ncbi:class I SAM-dependent methyltransferase [Flavobacterium sp. UBA7663]|uniref:class I SAM-dependent methyltransferase n=1 Tax=Flavobacterium sp. UBA7663 TaxID=1946557 RepID=UPI0025BF6E58|nr:class I SAM-dependent methyltransferase [Flavobacterium sp. UBA7663]
MIKYIKSIIPLSLISWYRKCKNAKFKKMSADEVFTDIYKNNHWKSAESISGEGSEIKQTKNLIKELNDLFEEKSVKSVLDLPCGDFNWMRKVDLSKIEYIGGDIVKELIEENTLKYKKENINFKVLNLISDSLPKCDIILVRDCFVHLSYADINKALKNIKSSGCKYILTTTYINHHVNYDIITGDWRPLNLQDVPFNFPTPLKIIIENSTEGNGQYKDKSMALWELEKLNFIN